MISTYAFSLLIIYRDIKLENILIEKDSSNEIQIKLIDFGIAEYFQPGTFMTALAGSDFYIAPEVILGKYGFKCDLWSIGVIAYTIIFGQFPFDGQSQEEIFKKILYAKFKFTADDK